MRVCEWGVENHGLPSSAVQRPFNLSQSRRIAYYRSFGFVLLVIGSCDCRYGMQTVHASGQRSSLDY